MDDPPRDLIGYGARTPRVEWLRGARLALERNPEAAAAIREADCDVVAHGWHWIDYHCVGEAPRMLTVAVHGRLIGRPGRIGGLARFLDPAQGHDGVWICRRRDIARHWIAHCPYGEG